MGNRICLGCGGEFDGESCPNNCHIADWECSSCGYSYHGMADVCPGCGSEVEEMTTDVEYLRMKISILKETNKKLEETLKKWEDMWEFGIITSDSPSGDPNENVFSRNCVNNVIMEHKSIWDFMSASDV